LLGEISIHAMAADRPVLLYAHPSMEGLAKAIVAGCEELKTNTSTCQQVRFLSRIVLILLASLLLVIRILSINYSFSFTK